MEIVFHLLSDSDVGYGFSSFEVLSLAIYLVCHINSACLTFDLSLFVGLSVNLFFFLSSGPKNAFLLYLDSYP